MSLLESILNSQQEVKKVDFKHIRLFLQFDKKEKNTSRCRISKNLVDKMGLGTQNGLDYGIVKLEDGTYSNPKMFLYSYLNNDKRLEPRSIFVGTPSTTTTNSSLLVTKPLAVYQLAQSLLDKIDIKLVYSVDLVLVNGQAITEAYCFHPDKLSKVVLREVNAISYDIEVTNIQYKK